jgi:predicted Zn-dependent protease
MEQIDNAMNKDNRPYYAAAQFYYDNGKDLKKAEEWINKAVTAEPDAYWMQLLKARILVKNGDKAGAKAAAQKTIEIATRAKNNDYVKLATDLLKGL